MHTTKALAARVAVPSAVTLLLLCVAQFLDAADISSVGIILPSIQNNFAMSPQMLQWVVSGYVLGFGGFLLLGGKVSDLFGRRRVFVVSMAFFGLASLAGALAPADWMVVATRILKGVAAGFTAPAALSLLLAAYSEPARRNKALGMYSIAGASGFVLGIVLGGFLGNINWRLVFLMPTVVALCVVVAALLILPPDRATKEKKQFDLLGAGLATGGLLMLVYGATQASAGWLAMASLGSVAAGFLLLAAFLYHQRTARVPLVPLAIFKTPGLGFAGVLAFFTQGNYTAFQFLAVLYLQSVLGLNPLQSATAFVFAAVIVGIGAPRFAGLALKVGTVPIIAPGAGLHLLAFLWFTQFEVIPPLVLFGVAQVLIGLGFAASFPALNIHGLAGAKEAQHGLASGIILSAFSIGSGIMVALVAAIFAASGTSGLGGYHQGMLLISALSLAAFVLSLFGLHRHSKNRRMAAQ